MPQRPRIALVFAIGLAAMLVPILASIYLAWNESVATERSLNDAYARDVLHRVEETADQFADGQATVEAAGFPPCSPQDIEIMRQIDLASNYIQAAGRTSGDTLLCTSLGSTTPVPLGKPSLISDHGVSEYYDVSLSPEQWHPINVFSAGGFAILVDTKLALDIPTEGSDVELAVFAPSAPDYCPFESTGKDFHPRWFQPLAKGSSATFIDNGYLVTSVRSAKWDLAVVAATPESYVYQRVRHFALLFTPVGILCGILLTWAVSSITSMLTSFPAVVRRAARRGDYFLEYQPIVELATRRIIGAEALVRWNAPLGVIRPEHFIPLAEERGLIQIITEQVVILVGRDLPFLLGADPNFEVTINMSASDLRSGRTLEFLDRLLNTTTARPGNIGIEATERAFLHGTETTALIATLRQRGFRVAIDDFGTGYSSLAALQSLSLDALKIDRAFVETINTDGATSQVVLHIIEMAHSLHLDLVAEGVETEAQAQFLYQRGVRFAQGWLFGKPMPLDALLKEMEKSTTGTGTKG